MPYSVEILRGAEKFLGKLSKRQPSDAAAIEDAIEDLSEDRRPRACTPLKGYSGIWRLRVGSYRVCYQIDEDQLLILVITISTRDDVYQVLQRHLGR